MKAHWKYQEYETTTGRALRFWFMKQWFPIRRACRFAKRALRRVKRWLPWYAAAACIVAVAYFGLAQFGLLSSEQARASFIGWVITGVLAVTVLDVCKVESNRRSSLTAQYDALCSRQHDFEWALQQLASACARMMLRAGLWARSGPAHEQVFQSSGRNSP